MVATVEEEEAGEKTELDLGFEESIRRCEALLAPLCTKEKDGVAEGQSKFLSSFLTWMENLLIWHS